MENFDCNIFCERVNSLFGNTGQMELAEKINLSQGVISSIKNKKVKAPGADTVFKIARYFNVSADWLLGMPNASKTTDKATKELCAALGLSEYAIAKLSDQENGGFRKAIDFLFEQHRRGIEEKKIEDFFFDVEHDLKSYSLLWELADFSDLCNAKNDFQLSVNKFGTLGLKYGTEKSSQDYMIQTDIEGEQYDFVSTFNELKMTEITNNILSILNSYKNRKKDMLLNSPSIGVFSVSLTREARFAKIQQSIKNGEFVEDMEDSNDPTSET